MSQKGTAGELIDALLDPKVVDALSNALGNTIAKIVETRIEANLSSILGKMSVLETSVNKQSDRISKLEDENAQLKLRVDEQDAYSRCENLILHGIQTSSYAEAASGSDLNVRTTRNSARRQTSNQAPSSTGPTESSEATEVSVLNFVNDVLNVPLTRNDISVAIYTLMYVFVWERVA